MFLLPNWLVSAFSFPGVIVHEFSHEMFCRFFGVKVNKVVYFQFDDEVAGYVSHNNPEKISQLFWITIGPLIGNTIISILLFRYSLFDSPTFEVMLVSFWLALAIALHAFPSNTDARNILDEANAIRKSGGSILYYLAYPFFAVIWTANRLKFFWFDVFYAALLFLIASTI